MDPGEYHDRFKPTSDEQCKKRNEIEPETTMTLFLEINVTIRSYQIVGTRNVVTHTDMARLSLLC